MILEWNSDIKVNSVFKKTGLPAVTRNYEIIDTHDNSVVATAWARDLHDKSNVFLHEGELFYQGHRYHIPKECRLGTDWEILDENNNRVMLFYRANETYLKKRKLFFSGKIIEKQKTMSYVEINLCEHKFRLYDHISLGKNKMTFNFYEDDNVVLEILQKDHKVNSGCFQTIYCQDEPIIKFLAVLYSYYLNVYENWQPDSIVTTELSESATILKNTNEYYTSKFSEEFIEEIKRKANIS